MQSVHAAAGRSHLHMYPHDVSSYELGHAHGEVAWLESEGPGLKSQQFTLHVIMQVMHVGV